MFKRTPTLITTVLAVVAMMLATGALATSASAATSPGYFEFQDHRLFTLSDRAEITNTSQSIRVYDPKAVFSGGAKGPVEIDLNYHLSFLHSKTLYVDSGELKWDRNADTNGGSLPLAAAELGLDTDYWNPASRATGELRVKDIDGFKLALDLQRLKITG
jgi:hypothetical protein